MSWFEQLKQALPAYYPEIGDEVLVGFLQGSVSPTVWKQMADLQGRHQMLILGNREPTREEWVAAGVAQRGNVQAVSIHDLGGWIVLYGGFMLRPWGQLHEATPDALTIGFPGSLQSWKKNTPRKRR